MDNIDSNITTHDVELNDLNMGFGDCRDESLDEPLLDQHWDPKQGDFMAVNKYFEGKLAFTNAYIQ